MNISWNNKWKSVLVWLSAYLSFIAFVIVGGYFCIKKEEEELQIATKRAFLVTLGFTAISAFFSLFHYIGGLANDYYVSSAYDFYSIGTTIVGIAKIIVFATFIILAIIKKDAPIASENNDNAENE